MRHDRIYILRDIQVMSLYADKTDWEKFESIFVVNNHKHTSDMEPSWGY